MKNDILKCTGLLICLVFIFSSFPQSVAAVVWEDNFNDGNYDGWTVEEGDWDASTQALTGAPPAWNVRIWHPSSQTTGTWSFDLLNTVDGPDAAHGDFYCKYDVHFMTNGSTSSPGCNISGYSIRILENSVYILRYDDYNPILLKFTILEGLKDALSHFDITRDATGAIYVYVNATPPTAEPVLELIDTTYDYSEYFVLDLIYNNVPSTLSSIDNITVDDEILITPLEPTPTDTTTPTDTETTTTTDTGNGEPFALDPMLLALGGGAVAVLVIVIVLLKRR